MLSNAEIPTHLRPAYTKMAEVYQEHMPESLYLNYYKLEELTKIPAEQWEDFLDIPEVDRFITHRISKLLEFDAKEALMRLTTDRSLSAPDISAIKEVLSSSKLMKQAQEQPTQVVLMKW